MEKQNEQLEPLKVDRTKLITQSKYAELIKISKQRVNQMIKDGKLTTVKIEGAVLVLMD